MSFMIPKIIITISPVPAPEQLTGPQIEIPWLTFMVTMIQLRKYGKNRAIEHLRDELHLSDEVTMMAIEMMQNVIALLDE